jgi:hypothetical protein
VNGKSGRRCRLPHPALSDEEAQLGHGAILRLRNSPPCSESLQLTDGNSFL